MRVLILFATMFVLLAGDAAAQWDVNENFNNGIPDDWTVTGGEWYWEENGPTFPTPYIWTYTPEPGDDIDLVAGPYDISGAENLVFQFQYFIHGTGDSEVYFAFDPDGPWHIIEFWSFPGRMYGVCNQVLNQDQLQGDEIYFRWTAIFHPDGWVQQYAIDNVRLSVQYPGWLDVRFFFPLNTHIPATGGPVEFDLTVTNTFNVPIPDLQFSMIVQHYGEIYGPFDQQQFSVPANGTLRVEDMVFDFPGDAPSSYYLLTPLVGVPNRPSLKFSDWWMCYKNAFTGETAGQQNPFDRWGLESPFDLTDPSADHTARDLEAAAESPDPGRPATFSLFPAHPNPFNGMTVLTVTLPEASTLTVTVFNTLGRQVAELADSDFTAGQHTFTFDGSSLASGIYFVHATIPGELNAVQKIVLMK